GWRWVAPAVTPGPTQRTTQGTDPQRGEERCPVGVLRASKSGDESDLLSLRALLALRDLELDALSVFQRLVAVHLDRGEVDENVLSAVDRDEAIALLAVEPLDGALC